MPPTVPSMTNRTLSGLLWMSLSSGANVGALLAVLIVLARFLTPADFGLAAVALMVISFSAIFSEFGIGPALVQRPSLRPEHLYAGFILSVGLGLCLGLVTWLSAPAVARFFDLAELTPMLQMLAWVFPVQGFAVVAESLLQRELRFRSLAAVEVVTSVVGYGVTGIAMALLGFGAWALVGAHMAQASLKTLLLLAIRPHGIWRFWDRGACADLLYFGGGYTTGRFSNWAAGQGEHAVIGYGLGATALGVYGRAYQLMAGPAVVFGNVLDRVLFPAMAQVQDQPQRLADAYRRGMALVALVMLPVSVVLVVLAPEVIEVVLGENWYAVILPLQILGAGMLFRTGCKISDALVRATGAVYRRGWRQTAYAILVVVGAWCGQWWGVEGVAIAILVTLIANFLLMAHLALSLTDMSWGRFARAHVPGFVLAAALGVPLMVTIQLLRAADAPSIVVLLVSMPALAPAVVLCGLFPGVFLGEDGRWMARKLKAFIRPTQDKPQDAAPTDEVAGAPGADHPLRRLVCALADEGVWHCRWKRHIDLARVLRGDGDLDLLVQPSDVPAFRRAAQRAGFVQTTPCFESPSSGEIHLYAPDDATGNLIHVHAHRSLSLPPMATDVANALDEMVLCHCAADRTSSVLQGMPVVQPGAELILLVLRAMAERARHGGLLVRSPNRQKLASRLALALQADCDETWRGLLTAWFPAIQESLFADCLRALQQPTPLWECRRLAHQVLGSGTSTAHARVSAEKGTGTGHCLANRVRAVFWRIRHGRGTPKRLTGGGAVIAIVGPDASGKSTMVAESARWLGQVFRVRTAHLGKPPSAWLTLLPNVLLRLMRVVTPRLRTSRLDAAAEATGRPVRRGLLYRLRAVLLAWDRRALAVRLTRQATRGWIIACDRYPSAAVGTADGARLPAPEDEVGVSRLNAFLARLENRLYRAVPAPAVVIRLSAPVTIALHRNEERVKAGKESADYVARRHKHFSLPVFPGTRMRVLDTSGSQADTVRGLRRLLWEALGATAVPTREMDQASDAPCPAALEEQTVALQES